MYSLDEITDEKEAFRQTVLEGRAFRPLYVKIKLMFGCNLKCEMCNHWREQREAPIAMERFREILSELADLGCRKIHLSGGEPMLRAQVPELVEYATQSGIRVTMTTNGTLIDKAKSKQLVEAGLRGVNLSLDSPIRKVHDKVRGVNGAWKKTTKALTLFRRYAHKGKLTIRINTVISRLNYTSLIGLPDLAAKLGADAINLIPVDDHCGEYLSMRKRDIALFNTEIAPRIADRSLNLGLIRDERQAYPFGRSEEEVKLARAGRYALGWYNRHPCYAPWTHSLIDYNGLVYVCCMTREQIPPLGDLKKQSFTEIWNGAGYKVIRQHMHPPALAACRRCDDFIGENQKIWETIGPY
jgi:MoaA/NifB/PqqE/SkfB family radical SAM enzyme